jgi:ubiquinone/menaquinone biosynthesis C-methylase UbiE
MKTKRFRYLMWQKLKDNSYAEQMMRDDSLKKKEIEERAEIFALLPEFNGKTILDMGAGVGRFTTKFAKKAGKVYAVDLLEHALNKNKKRNKNFNNIEYICSDALDIFLPENSCDIIFSSWLLMYLSENEIDQFLKKCRSWLTPGGQIFFKESCETSVLGYSIYKTAIIGILQKFTKITINKYIATAPSLADIKNKLIKKSKEQSVYYRKKFVYEQLFSKYFQISKTGNIKVFEELYNNKNQKYWILTL